MTGDEFIPTLTHATERDIDLLLVEELYASGAFVAWMAAKAGLTGRIARSTVLHSKRRTRSRREIDIFVEMYSETEARSALLIENKLDAGEQPDQAESYRAELERVAGDYAATAMIIVCPSGYADQHRQFAAKFDAVVSYEDLAGYFSHGAAAHAGEVEARMRFRRDVMEQAVHKHRRGYTAVPNETVGDFNARYVALLRGVAPAIVPGKSMLRPANPDESTSMIFDHVTCLAALPADLRPTRFSHELGRGQERRANYVAVTFGGWGSAVEAVRGSITRDMEALRPTVFAKLATKARPNPGLVVACPTLPVDNQGSFDAQVDSITKGMKKAVELRSWLLANATAVRSWKVLAMRHKGSS